jgi:hypothetical protein
MPTDQPRTNKQTNNRPKQRTRNSPVRRQGPVLGAAHEFRSGADVAEYVEAARADAIRVHATESLPFVLRTDLRVLR